MMFGFYTLLYCPNPGPHDWCAFARLWRFDRLPRPPRRIGRAMDGHRPPLRPLGARARVAPACRALIPE